MYRGLHADFTHLWEYIFNEFFSNVIINKYLHIIYFQKYAVTATFYSN